MTTKNKDKRMNMIKKNNNKGKHKKRDMKNDKNNKDEKR